VSVERRASADGLVRAIFPRRAPPPPPAETEMAELLPADDVEAWALEHETTREGHECEDLLLCEHAQARRAVYCPECQVLVGEREVLVGEDPWAIVNPAGPPPEPTHAETAALVFTANAGVGVLLALITWLLSLGFTSSDLALLIAAGAFAVYGALARPPVA
jgi:hypothetical protein